MTMLGLVIDDSRAMRLILRRITVQLGFEVWEAGNGREALDMLAEAGDDAIPQLALVDWNMPEMDGLEFVTAVRGDPRLRGITLIMVTSEGEQSQLVTALAAGGHEDVIHAFPPDARAEKLALLGLLPDGVSA
jgi:two-component system chemotaxis response regulator CheY